MIGRLLGIDHGIKRIGIAVSDALGLTTRELTIIHRTTRIEDFAKINQIANEQAVKAIIIGIPDNPNAHSGTYTQADTVRLWIERFSKTTELPIIGWGEYLSSEEAREISIQQKRNPRDPIDDLAARVILQSYLDALRYDSATLPPSLKNT